MSSRRRKQQNRAGKACISLIVIMFLAVMSVQIVKLYQKDQEYSAREQQLTEELQEETERQADLQEYEEYTKSQEYIEDVAKSRLGLVYDNQIVFKEDKE